MPNITINNLDSIYQAGIPSFVNNLFQEKIKANQGLVFFIGGQEVDLSHNDVVFLYQLMQQPPNAIETEYLKEKAREGKTIRYALTDSILEVPATLVLELFSTTSSLPD